jgi:hypothetical protein
MTLWVPKMSSTHVRAHAVGDQVPGAVLLGDQLRTADWKVILTA